MDIGHDMGGSFVRLDNEVKKEDQIVSRLIELTSCGTLKWSKLFINSTAWNYAVDFSGVRFQVSDFFNKGIGTLSVILLDVFSRDIENNRSRSCVSNKVQELKTAIEKQGPPNRDYTRYVLDKSGNKTFLETVWGKLNS